MVDYPDNAWTRMIGRAQEMNSEIRGGAGISLATPMPTVQSATMGREVVEQVPLSFEEREDLDAKARALGLLPPLPGEGQGEYDSYEAALEAARGPEAPASEAPTVDPVLAMAHNARLARAARLGAPAPRMEQPMFAAEPTVVEVPRLPDFQNVQGIDLKKGVAYLDSMEFELGENDLRKLRKFVVQLAHHAFMARLNAAMGLFDPEGTDGNTVQGVRGE